MSGSRSLSLESVAIRVVRLLAILLIWSAVVAMGMGYFFSPIGVEAQPSYNDLVGFGCAFAISGAVTASIVLTVAGKRNWAVELALAVVLTIATTAVVAALALWAAPMTVRSRMDAWSFLRLQQDVLDWGEAIVKFHAPLAAEVGSVVGAIAGLLIVLARRRRRLVGGISLGLLVACAAEPVRPILFGLVILSGQIIRFLSGTWPRTPDEVWATAAVLGAIAGAFVAGFSIRLAHRDRAVRNPQTTEDRGPVFPHSTRRRAREDRDQGPTEEPAIPDDSRRASD